MKKSFYYFVYISIGFLLYYLVKNNSLTYVKIYNYPYLILSLLFLFLGFFANIFTWHRLLLIAGLPVSFKHSFISHGLAIFGKYIPGKIWVIVGRAFYVSEKYCISKEITTTFSFLGQIITLWAGLLVGSVGVFYMEKVSYWPIFVFLCWLLFSIYIFSPVFQKILSLFLKKIFNKLVIIPTIGFKNVLYLMPLYLGYWLLWCISFYLLIGALSNSPAEWYHGTNFALAGTFGIIAFIFPGGIGVREGLLVACLTLSGMQLNDALTISLASRIWFLIGESGIFLIAVTLNIREE